MALNGHHYRHSQRYFWLRASKWGYRTSALSEYSQSRASVRIFVRCGGLPEEEELVAACVEHIKAHKSAQELVDELEPVLAEEATDFVIKVSVSVFRGSHRFCTVSVNERRLGCTRARQRAIQKKAFTFAGKLVPILRCHCEKDPNPQQLFLQLQCRSVASRRAYRHVALPSSPSPTSIR